MGIFDDLIEDQKKAFHRMLLPEDHPDAVQDMEGRWMESDEAFKKRIKAGLKK